MEVESAILELRHRKVFPHCKGKLPMCHPHVLGTQKHVIVVNMGNQRSDDDTHGAMARPQLQHFLNLRKKKPHHTIAVVLHERQPSVHNLPSDNNIQLWFESPPSATTVLRGGCWLMTLHGAMQEDLPEPELLNDGKRKTELLMALGPHLRSQV